MTALRTMILAAAAGLALVGCTKSVTAPTTPRVCYYASEQKDGTWLFTEVATNQKQIENCAVELERMRLRFLRMGGSNSEIVGSYQGEFIFLQQEGVFFSPTFNGIRYLALRRYDGKLIMPGAIQEGP
jgi:hypothetical protein